MQRRLAVVAALAVCAAGCRTFKRPPAVDEAVIVDARWRAAPAVMPVVPMTGLFRAQKPPKDSEDESTAAVRSPVAAAEPSSSDTAKVLPAPPQKKDPPKAAACDSDWSQDKDQDGDTPPERKAVLGAHRAVGSMPSPGLGTVGKGLASSKYLSPARLRRKDTGGGAAERAVTPAGAILKTPDGAEPSEAAGEVEPARAGSLKADVEDALFVDKLDIGSFRVQIATSSDFSSPLYDQVFALVDNVDVQRDFELGLSRGRGGDYWVRTAPIDLLGFQHPYVRARRYRFVGRAKLAAIVE